jgi:hypothetical protein
VGGYFFSVIVDNPTNGGRYPLFMAVSKVDNSGEPRAAWANATSSSGVELVWCVIAAAVATSASISVEASYGGCSVALSIGSSGAGASRSFDTLSSVLSLSCSACSAASSALASSSSSLVAWSNSGSSDSSIDSGGGTMAAWVTAGWSSVSSLASAANRFVEAHRETVLRLRVSVSVGTSDAELLVRDGIAET